MTGQQRPRRPPPRLSRPDEARQRGAGCRGPSDRRAAAGSRMAAPGRPAHTAVPGAARRAGRTRRGRAAATPAGSASRRAARCPGQDDLATVPDGRDPGRTADLETAVVVAGQVRLAACAGPSARGSGHPARGGRRGHAGRRRPRRRPHRPRGRPRTRRPLRSARPTPPWSSMAVWMQPEVFGVDVVPARARARGRAAIEPSTSVRRNVTVPTGKRPDVAPRSDWHHMRLRRSASVGQHRHGGVGPLARIAFSPSPPTTAARTARLGDDGRDPRALAQHRELADVLARLVGADAPGRAVGLDLLHADGALEEHDEPVPEVAFGHERLVRRVDPLDRRSRRSAGGPRGRGPRRAARAEAGASSRAPPSNGSPRPSSPPPPHASARRRNHGSSSWPKRSRMASRVGSSVCRASSSSRTTRPASAGRRATRAPRSPGRGRPGSSAARQRRISPDASGAPSDGERAEE